MIDVDIANNIYYSSWFAMALFLISVLSFGFNNTTLQVIGYNIIGVFFDIAVILVAIGILRASKHEQKVKNEYIGGWLLISASILDIARNISVLFLLIIHFQDSLSLLLIQLIFVIPVYLLLIAGFIFVKRFMDKLYAIELTKVVHKTYLVIGYSIMLLGFILSWVNSYLRLLGHPAISLIAQFGFFFLLIATFFVIIGFLNLSLSARSLKELIKEKELTSDNGNSEEEDDADELIYFADNSGGEQN